MNIELFEKIKAAMRANPERVNMGTWFCQDNQEASYYKDLKLDCGTTGCIAGWTISLAYEGRINLISDDIYQDARLTKRLEAVDVIVPSIVPKAMRLLDIENDFLFYTGGWPRHIFEQYHDPLATKKDKVEAICAAIDRYIEVEGNIAVFGYDD